MLTETMKVMNPEDTFTRENRWVKWGTVNSDTE